MDIIPGYLRFGVAGGAEAVLQTAEINRSATANSLTPDKHCLLSAVTLGKPTGLPNRKREPAPVSALAEEGQAIKCLCEVKKID